MSSILIVDDSPTDTYVAKKCAEVLFTEVHSTHDVAGLLRVLSEIRPSLITMDVNLFDWQNGISLIAEIRDGQDETSIIPIVVISSRSTPADKNIAMDAGASAYIVKPVTVEQLEKVAQDLIPGYARPLPRGT